MNNILNELVQCITKNYCNYNISERNKFLETSFNAQKGDISQFVKIKEVLEKFPSRDVVEINFCNSLEDTFVIVNDSEMIEEDFNAFFSEGLADEEYDVEIVIKKHVENQTLSIYNYEKFCEYILSLDMVEIVKSIEDDIQNNERLIWEVYNQKVFWATKTIIVKNIEDENKIEKFDRIGRLEVCRKNNNVFWEGNILPIPDDFHFVIENSTNPFKEIFKKIETMLSAIYISDNARIIPSRDILECEVIGQRMNDYEIILSEIDYNSVLFDIYSWAYTEGNVVDKVIILRNLLSMHCRYTAITKIDEKTFGSIKVNYSLYQKENVEEFIKMKNTMIQFISDAIDQSQTIIEKIVGNLGKNIIAFFSFVFTAFITNIVSEKGLDNIFTKDITSLCYAVIGGSICFLVVTYIISEFSIKKVEKKYNTIKVNSSFLENSKEYEEIFDESQLNNIVQEVCEYRKKLLACWIISLILILLVIEIRSSYSISRGVIEQVSKLL